MDKDELILKLSERGYNFRRNDGVLIIPETHPYFISIEESRKRHEKYCNSNNITEISQDEYLSDAIQDDYMNWKCGDKIWINTKCGSGKTTFVIKIIEHFVKRRYKILYLSNRSYLLNQVKLNLLQKFRSKYKGKSIPTVCLNDINISDDIYCFNYQSLVGAYKNNKDFNPEIFNDQQVLLICDEVHWFTSDCLFSDSPDIVLDRLLQQFSKSLTLYMTSTDWDIYPLIGDKLKPFYCIGERSILPFSHCYIGECFNKSNVEVYSFTSYGSIINKINESSPEEKWIIYADKKETAESLKKQIDNSCSIFRDDFNYKMTPEDDEEIEAIVNQQKFDCRVLISTSILDCGISINDKNVKHIVISSIDPVTTMQFVGRVRRYKNSKINIYFNALPTKYIWQQFYSRDDELKYADKMVSDKRFLSDKSSELSYLWKISRLYFTVEGKMLKNKLGEYKSKLLATYLSYILFDSLDYDEKAFLLNQLNLFGFSLEECHDLDIGKIQEAENNVKSVIENYVNKELSEEDYKEACKTIDAALIKNYGSDIIRGNGLHRYNTYNKIFNEINLPYVLEKNGNKKDNTTTYLFKNGKQ